MKGKSPTTSGTDGAPTAFEVARAWSEGGGGLRGRFEGVRGRGGRRRGCGEEDVE